MNRVRSAGEGTATTPRHAAAVPHREPLKRITLLVGVVFLALGVLGFVPGVTTNYDEMELAGHESRSELFGIFQVSILHNTVHLLLGVVGVLMARTIQTARLYLVGGGLIYLVLWLYGAMIDRTGDENFVPVNDADNWLHLGLGVAMVGVGLLLGRGRSESASDAVRRRSASP